MNRERVKYLLKEEPYKIGHSVGFKDLTLLHNEWIKSFLCSKENQTLLAHRGSYKTTCISLFLAIHTIVKPNEFIDFFRKTDTDVQEVLRQVANILRTDVMQDIVQLIYGRELIIEKDTANEVHTNLCTSTKGSSQIVGLGITTSITGKHADIVITDDIVNTKDRESKAERERTKRQYMELQNVLNRGGRFINCGTPWHKDDAIGLMENVKKYDCYSTGLITREKIEQLRRSMTDSLFAANYELKHIADKDAMFKKPQFTSDISAIYNGMAHVDAAYGGEDSTAYTVFRQNGDEIIGFGKLWNKHADDCIEEIKRLHNQLRAGSISCEKNGDKGYFAEKLQKNGFLVKPYNENENKYIKISTYLRSNWNKIKWLEDTDPDYIDNILDYSEFADHDDAPDSAASLLRLMQNRRQYNPVKGGI